MMHLPTVALSVTCVVILALRPIAQGIGLTDRPGGRKIHSGEVPLIGGLAMFVAIAAGVGLMPSSDPDAVYLLGACALLLTVGLADDRFDVPAKTRLAAHFAAAWLAVLMLDGGPSLTFGSAFGAGDTVLTGWTATAVVTLLVGGTINAFNMIDGMDGLCGVMALIALSVLGWLAATSGDAFGGQFCLVAMGAVGGFLLFNLPLRFNRKWHVFMGDAGSTLFGFIVAALCMRLSQEGGAVAPATLLWFVAVPVTDLLATMLRRMARGESPFRPDRGHLHHRLLDAGLNVPATLTVMTIAAVLCASIGLWMHYARIPQVVQFYGFLVAAATLALAVFGARQWVRLLPSVRLAEAALRNEKSQSASTDVLTRGRHGE